MPYTKESMRCLQQSRTNETGSRFTKLMAFWSPIESEKALEELIESSEKSPVFILKHSFRCALSTMVKGRIEKNGDERLQYYLIDVVTNRAVSNLLAEMFSVQHESPQAFLVKDAKLIEVKSHLAIKPHAFSVLLDSFADHSANP